MRGIYRFHWDCGRGGALSGLFIATAEEVASAIGKTAYFGEVLGKHSDVRGKIEEGEIVLISDAEADIEVFERLKLTSGHNPLLRIEYACEKCGERFEEPMASPCVYCAGRG